MNLIPQLNSYPFAKIPAIRVRKLHPSTLILQPFFRNLLIPSHFGTFALIFFLQPSAFSLQPFFLGLPGICPTPCGILDPKLRTKQLTEGQNE